MHNYFDDTQLLIISHLRTKFEKEKQDAIKELEREHHILMNKIVKFHDSMGINPILCDNCNQFEMSEFASICFQCHSAICESCNKALATHCEHPETGEIFCNHCFNNPDIEGI